MQNDVGGKILGINDSVTNFWYNLSFSNEPLVILDILLVATIIYWCYLLIKETRAIRILYGILFLGGIMIIGQVLHLSGLNWLLSKLFTMILVAIPVVFQPELRSALERIGRTRFVGNYTSLGKAEIDLVVKDLVESVKILSKNKVGALIVLVQKTGLKDIIDTGKPIGAKLSPEIILTIFTPNTPLHDGAVMINGKKIIAASCTLPLSEVNFSLKVGTRHKAAVGISSQSDAIVVVVSEETGAISISFNGELYHHLELKEFEQFLSDLLKHKSITTKKEIAKNKMV